MRPLSLGPIATFERHFLDELTKRNRHRTLLHAGAVVMGGRLVLLVGPSGAGKSSFTKWALLAGAGYLTDDFALVEGQRVSGVARTVQFDAIPPGPMPVHHDGCETHAYPGLADSWAVPLLAGEYPVVEHYDATGAEVVVVRIEKGAEETIEPMSSLARLGELHAASLAVGAPYSGVFDAGPGFRVTWTDSRRASAKLFELLAEL